MFRGAAQGVMAVGGGSRYSPRRTGVPPVRVAMGGAVPPLGREQEAPPVDTVLPVGSRYWVHGGGRDTEMRARFSAVRVAIGRDTG